MSGKVHPDKMTKKQLEREVREARRQQEIKTQGYSGVHPCVNSCTKCGCAATACGCGIAAACGSGCNVMGGGKRKTRRRKGGGIFEKHQDLAVKLAKVTNKAWKKKEAQAEHLGEDHKERIVTTFRDALEIGYTNVENKNDFQDKLIDTVNQIVFYHNAVTKDIQTKSNGDTYLTNSVELEKNLKWFNTLIKSAFKYKIITKEEKISLLPLRRPYIKFSEKYVDDVKHKKRELEEQIKNILMEQPDQGGRKKRRRTKKKKRRRKRTKKKRKRRRMFRK